MECARCESASDGIGERKGSRGGRRESHWCVSPPHPVTVLSSFLSSLLLPSLLSLLVCSRVSLHCNSSEWRVASSSLLRPFLPYHSSTHTLNSSIYSIHHTTQHTTLRHTRHIPSTCNNESIVAGRRTKFFLSISHSHTFCSTATQRHAVQASAPSASPVSRLSTCEIAS